MEGIRKRRWIDSTGWMPGTLKEAKGVSQERAAAVIGEKLPVGKWR